MRRAKITAPTGPGLKVPQDGYWLRAEVPGVGFDIRFRVGMTDEGALVITGLLLGDPTGTQSISTSMLHKLSMGSLYEAVAQQVSRTYMTERAHAFDGAVPTRGGQRTSDARIEQAAKLYRTAVVRRPGDPIAAVAEELGVSSATASRRVQAARDRGLLSAGGAS